MKECIEMAEDEIGKISSRKILKKLHSGKDKVFGMGKFTAQSFFPLCALCGLLKNVERATHAEIADCNAAHKWFQKHGCTKSNERDQLLKFLCFGFDLTLGMVENTLCEITRKDPKADYFFEGQHLQNFIQIESTWYAVELRNNK